MGFVASKASPCESLEYTLDEASDVGREGDRPTTEPHCPLRSSSKEHSDRRLLAGGMSDSQGYQKEAVVGLLCMLAEE